MATEDGARPEHDPLAEDLDLLTSKEGVARVYDELQASRAVVATLERDRDADPAALAEARARVEDLEEAIARMRTPTAPNW